MFITMKKSNKVVAAMFSLLSSVAAESVTTKSYLRSGRNLGSISSCNVHVQFGECPVTEIEPDNGCFNPFQVVTFKYYGGDCSQSSNLLQNHEFTCEDMHGGMPRSSTVTEGPQGGHVKDYITVTSQYGGETYFAGYVSVGDEYTLNADEKYSVLIGEMTITIYESEGGTPLQKTNLLLDCTNPLFLSDKFGASQVQYWKETDGREVKLPDVGPRSASIPILVNNPDDTFYVHLLEMSLHTNAQAEPVDYTPEIKGIDLLPRQTKSLAYKFQYNYEEYGAGRTRYTFYTFIKATSARGEDCNDYAMLECFL